MKTDQKVEHTPGPWTLHPRIELAEPIIYHNGCIVATVNTSAPEVNERKANAYLIAAAPDLLTICQRLSGFNIHTSLLETGVLDDLKAAVRKAEGEVSA